MGRTTQRSARVSVLCQEGENKGHLFSSIITKKTSNIVCEFSCNELICSAELSCNIFIRSGLQILICQGFFILDMEMLRCELSVYMHELLNVFMICSESLFIHIYQIDVDFVLKR
jgi:hypothetical protein